MVYFLSVLWHDAKIVGIDKNGLWVCFNYLYCWYQSTFSWSFFFGDKMKKCEQTALFNKCFWFCFKIFLYCIYEAVGWIMMVNVSYSNTAYYIGWLSVVYSLKDRPLKNLLVFSSKIEDLTLFFVANLKTEGKWGKLPSFAPKPPVRKDKAYRG